MLVASNIFWSFMEIDLINLDLISIRFRVILQQTKKITKEDIELFEEWRWLTSQYQSCNKKAPKPHIYGVVSVLNAIFNQRRLVFGMTRKKTSSLIRTDENWNPKKGLRNGNYSKILGFLIKNNFIEPVKYDAVGNQKMLLFKVINKEMINMISVDYEEQLEESINFALTEIKEEEESEEKPEIKETSKKNIQNTKDKEKEDLSDDDEDCYTQSFDFNKIEDRDV